MLRDPTPISAGLPQGGILSPLLWVLFFNTIHDDLGKLRKEAGCELRRFLDLIFADDSTTVAIADPPQASSQIANFTAQAMEKVPKLKYLATQRAKTQNLLFEPRIIPLGLFRRDDRTVAPSTKTRMREQLQREAKHGHMMNEVVLEFDPYEEPTADV